MMTGFSGWVRHHRRSILFLLTLLVAGGTFSAWRLPVSLFPQVDFPRVVVNFDAGDRPAERMEMEVTRPEELAVRAVPGVRRVRSTTSRGSAELSVDFDWGLDMVSALLQVESAVNQTLPDLPAGTRFEARRMDPTVFPVLGYSLTSDTLSPVALRDLATYQLAPLLSTVNGVAKIDVEGGDTEEIHVTTDPARLAAYGLTVDDLSKALAAANVLTAVGRLQDHDKLYLLLTDTRLTDLAKVRDTVLRVGGNGVVRVGDVAEVGPGVAPVYVRVTADGHAAVLLSIHQQPGGNTVHINRDLKAKFAEYRPRLPKGVRVANWYDQSQLILESATSVRDAVLIGAVLAAGVLLLFLRNWKITFVAVVCVPAVLASTTLLLGALGQSFNIMTLGGMAAAVGLIIDDAIGMVEHLVRRLREREELLPEAVRIAPSRLLAAAREFTPQLTASSLSTVVIFAPLAFLSGVTGAFFKALSLTMAIALILSYFVTLLAVPVLADLLLGEKDAAQDDEGRWTARLHHGYERLMGWCFPRKGLVLLALLPLCVVGYVAYQHVGTGFMPELDEGGFNIDYHSAPGTSLSETSRLLQQFETIPAPDPGGRHLLPPHRPATRRLADRGQPGRLLRLAQAASTPGHRRGDGRRARPLGETGARPGGGVRAAHGRSHRRPDQRAAAHRDSALRRGSSDVGTHRQRRGGSGGQDRRGGGREKRPRHRGRRAGHRDRPAQGRHRGHRPGGDHHTTFRRADRCDRYAGRPQPQDRRRAGGPARRRPRPHGPARRPAHPRPRRPPFPVAGGRRHPHAGRPA